VRVKLDHIFAREGRWRGKIQQDAGIERITVPVAKSSEAGFPGLG
jgi:hypothetical protein